MLFGTKIKLEIDERILLKVRSSFVKVLAAKQIQAIT